MGVVLSLFLGFSYCSSLSLQPDPEASRKTVGTETIGHNKTVRAFGIVTSLECRVEYNEVHSIPRLGSGVDLFLLNEHCSVTFPQAAV